MATIPVLGDLDLTKHEIKNPKAHLLAADPGSPAEGQFYWHTGAKEWRVHNGTAFVALGGGSLTGATDSAELDFTVTTGNLTASLIAGSVALTKLANIANGTILINDSGSAGPPLARTVAQTKTLLAIVPADVTGFDTQVRTSRLDQMAVPTADLNLNSRKITALADGTAVNDAINLGQLQAAIEGRQWKDPVATATTGVLPNTPTYNSGAGTLTAGSNTTLAAQAGHTMLVGERILVKDQASTFQNGIYSMTAAGSGAAPWVLTRVADASTAGELSNATTTVEASDSTLKGKTYTQQNTLANLTADAQSYTITGDNNTYTADGSTLSLSGNQFSVAANGITATQLNTSVAGNGLAGGGGTALSVNTGTASATLLELSGDTVRISADAAGNGLTGGAGSALAVGAGTGITVNANDVQVNTAVVVRKHSQDYGNGSLTDVPITHSLGTDDISVEVIRNSDNVRVWVPWTATSTSVVTINHDVAPTTDQYRVIVHA